MSVWTQDRGFIGKTALLAERLTQITGRISPSFILLLARISIAAVFWQAGRSKMDGVLTVKANTVFLFENIYRLPLIPADFAAYLTAYSEQLFSALLVVGFASRVSAIGLLTITVAIQVFVFSANLHEFLSTVFAHAMWATLLLFIMSQGAGKVSLDHLLFRSRQR